MKATLIFPPATDPRSPHLALPSLAAVLRAGGLDTSLLDLDVEGMHELLKHEVLQQAGERLREKYTFTNRVDRGTLQRAITLSEELPDRIGGALATLKNAEQFHDPNEFHAARETIFNSLDIVSLASPTPLRYNIDPLGYSVDGIDVQSMKDLIEATADRNCNLFADYWDAVVFEKLETQNPDFIGITITNRQQILTGLTLARALRKLGHFVIIGGTVYTKFTQQLTRLPSFFHYFADGVVVYEGESALSELTCRMQGDRDFSKVPNFLYLKGGDVNFTRVHVEDVSSLPTPDFDGLPLEKYLTPKPVLPVLFGKGCYFNRCKFCDIPYINSISKKAYRIRSPETVVMDLLTLNSRYACRHFQFTDEALSPRLLDRLATALEPHGDRRFRFVGYARLEPAFTSDRCQRIAAMGMTKFFFGLESGAQETIDHMDKKIRISEVPKILQNCREAGIRFHVFSIVGFPEESEKSARKTYRFFVENTAVIDIPGNSFDIHPFGLDLRTRYADQAEDNGIVISPAALANEFIIGVGDQWTNTRGLSHDDVHRLIAEFNLQLRQLYRAYHGCTQPIWPPFEEFAVLYSDCFAQREFPYRTSLPDATKLPGYRLRWSPAALVWRDTADTVIVSSRESDACVDATTYEALNNQACVTAMASLADCQGQPHTPITKLLVRQLINTYLAKGLLQLVPVGEQFEAKARP